MGTMLPLVHIGRCSAICFFQRRFKSKTHWAKLNKKTGPTHKAMDHFDDFYGSVFGDKWEAIRKALLRKQKYIALVNNYGDTDATIEMLTNRGAHDMKKLLAVDREFRSEYYSGPPDEAQEPSAADAAVRVHAARAQAREIDELYPGEGAPDVLEAPGVTLRRDGAVTEDDKRVAYDALSLDKSLLLARPDESRLIDAGSGTLAQALWQFVPATRLKGMEDWVPESQHYAYYSKGQDFPLNIEPEMDFTFPEHLKVFTYELENVSTFPEPKRGETGVFNYYPMDGASVMPVLALGLRPGDRVLELCAAPGGKTLVALQTLLPDTVVCNDISHSRTNRMHQVFRDYLPDFDTSNRWRERIFFSRMDGRHYTDQLLFDKVLVDVPCTTDRHSVKVTENNIFRPDRIKERLRIPEMQSQLLLNALRMVRVGGTVVYATCTLSPVQNDGVVHLALKQAFTEHGIQAIIRNTADSMAPFRSMLRVALGAAAPRYGTLVTPHVSANFGPSYFSKMVRVS